MYTRRTWVFGAVKGYIVCGAEDTKRGVDGDRKSICDGYIPTCNEKQDPTMTMHRQRFFSLALGLLAIWLSAAVGAANLERQRASFLEAEKALQKGQKARFEQLSASLRDYPLHPYLDYQSLRRDLKLASPERVRAFISDNADTPLADRLRGLWLSQLARQGRWSTYLAFYQPTDSTLARCRQLHAMIKTGQADKAYADVPDIWLHGESQPKECDSVLDAWRAAGGLTQTLVWQRIELAFAAGQWRLARYLKRYLDTDERPWVDLWLRTHREPGLVQSHPDLFAKQHPMRSAILEHGLKQLAKRDPARAIDAWRSVRSRFDFPNSDSARVDRHLALALARDGHPDALAYLARIEPRDDDLTLAETRIRTALAKEDWAAALAWIEALPPKARGLERWGYWRARALGELGRDDDARSGFEDLSRERSYYGFLAADRVGASYHLDPVRLSVGAEPLAEVAADPGIRRARELLALDRLIDARREWHHATADMDKTQLQAASKLAQSWGWHDRAIFTLARTQYWDDLELRFPLEHRALVERLARSQGLDPAWVYAVVRQESAFVKDARSSAGALGLMQLMPRTARSVARKLGEHPPRSRDLFRPETNIRLGSAYLKRIFDKLGAHPVLATAAYNAGLSRVESWLPDARLDADLWVELIPFRETRRYVERVLTYTAIYQDRLGTQPTRLSKRMQPVGSRMPLALQHSERNAEKASSSRS